MGHSTPTVWAGRRVFVTGCTGFLGGWVVRELVARGATVTGLVRNTPDRDSLFVRDRLFDRVNVVRGRVEDAARLTTALAIHEPQTVLHLAAPTVRPAGEPTELRWAETLLTAVRRTVPTAGVVIPVQADTQNLVKLCGVGERSGVRLDITQLPRLFGDGDRTWTRLVPRLARALVEGTPVVSPTADERTAGYLHAQEAAEVILQSAETVPVAGPCAHLHAVAPAVTGGRLFDALVADPGRVPGVASTLAWYRRVLVGSDRPAVAARTRRAA
ncbi:MAG: NAD-dependent epimerase/dehydratase family protein [Gemmataceae bacterium]